MSTAYPCLYISTHSRAKAAGFSEPSGTGIITHFNSQPREGGWHTRQRIRQCDNNFNSQPREGGWNGLYVDVNTAYKFQLTAARRRLAG